MNLLETNPGGIEWPPDGTLSRLRLLESQPLSVNPLGLPIHAYGTILDLLMERELCQSQKFILLTLSHLFQNLE